jgi:hypothetical protein
LLPNGQVLIAGGETLTSNGPIPSNTAELFNSGTGTFTATGSMSVGREDHIASLLNNGLVLVAGFNNPADLYTPASMPAAKIMAPINSAVVQKTVNIFTAVSPQTEWVNLYMDGNYLASSPPFNFSWDSTTVPNGSHTLSIKAFGNSGQVGSDSITVQVQNGTVGTAGPVKINAPSNGATVSGTVSIATTFSSPVVWENIYIDGNYFTSSPPSTFSWDSTIVANGSHTISAKGFNSSGLVGSDSVTVTVANGTTSSAVKITSPTNNATVTGAITIATTINSSVVWENVYIDGQYLASSPPTTFQWNSTSVVNGSHVISAKGFGSGGALAGSDSITVNVSN